jgi:hypothetical protein
MTPHGLSLLGKDLIKGYFQSRSKPEFYNGKASPNVSEV